MLQKTEFLLFEQKKVVRGTFEGTNEPGTDKRREDSKADNGSGGRFLQE